MQVQAYQKQYRVWEEGIVVDYWPISTICQKVIDLLIHITFATKTVIKKSLECQSKVEYLESKDKSIVFAGQQLSIKKRKLTYLKANLYRSSFILASRLASMNVDHYICRWDVKYLQKTINPSLCHAIDILKSLSVLNPDEVEGVSLFFLHISLTSLRISSNLLKKILSMPTNLPLLMRSISEIVLDLKMQGKKQTLVLQLLILLVSCLEITSSLRKTSRWMMIFLLSSGNSPMKSSMNPISSSSLIGLLLMIIMILSYTSQGTIGLINFVKNFFTTPAQAQPLYSPTFLKESPSPILESSSIICSSSSIEPDFLKMPYSYRKGLLSLSVASKILRGIGMLS